MLQADKSTVEINDGREWSFDSFSFLKGQVELW